MHAYATCCRSGSRSGLSIVVLFTGLMTGCITMDIPPDKVRPLDAYPLKVEQQGLTIAVSALGRKEAKEVFGTDLLDDGVLPILIMAENRNPSTSFVLAKSKVLVADANAVPSGKTGVGQTKEAVGGVLSAAGVILMSPLALVGTKLSSDAGTVSHGMGLKELQSHTVDPGQQVHGYVYVPISTEVRGKQVNLRATIEATDTSNFKSMTFDIPINNAVK